MYVKEKLKGSMEFLTLFWFLECYLYHTLLSVSELLESTLVIVNPSTCPRAFYLEEFTNLND